MKIINRKRTVGLLLCLTLFGSLFAVEKGNSAELNPRQKEFQELLDGFQSGRSGLQEKDLIRMLTLAREVGRPFAAAAAARSYAATHPEMSPQLQSLIARNSVLAADFRNAVSRYKSYLNVASPGRESSDIAAEMYVSQLDFLDTAPDAYESMKIYGDRFGASDAARKFEHWYLLRLQRSGDLSSYTERLISIVSEKMPIEKEQFFYWDYIEWLMNAIRRPTSAHMEISSQIEKLAGLLRADKAMQARYRFYMANLAYKATSVGRGAEEVEKNFEAAAVSARTFFDASPDFDTLQDILDVFSNNFNVNEWRIAENKKREFFTYAFAKLSDADKVKFLRQPAARTRFLLSDEQWESLCIASPKSFAEAASFNVPAKNPEVFKRQAQFLKGAQSEYAAVINSMAAGNDFKAIASHLIDNESWHLPSGKAYSLIENELWAAYRALQETAPGAEDYGRFLADFGREKLVSSPLPLLDTGFAGRFLLNAWRYGDKTEYVEILGAFDWIPYTESQAKTVFEPAYKEFVEWTSQARTAATTRKNAEDRIKAHKDAVARRTAAEEAKKAAEAKVAEGAAGAQAELNAANAAWNTADKDVASTAGPAAEAEKVLEKLGDELADPAAVISEVEAAFRTLMSAKSADPEKAPNALCKNLALAVQSVQAGNGEEFLEQAGQIYQAIKDYRAKKTPLGIAVLEFIVSNHFDEFDTLDFQVEVLAGELAGFDPDAPIGGARTVYQAISSGRSGWPGNAPADDRDKILKVNAVIDATLKELLEKNKFSGTLFTWLRQTRKGNRWQHGEAGNDVMTTMIQKKTLLQADYRVSGVNSAACTYMWLVKNEFQRLEDRFPSASFFDDMFVEEANSTGKLDYSYWGLGSDSQGKVVNVATKLLQQHKTLPVRLSEFERTSDLWRWHSQCLNMDKAWRTERKVDEAERGKLIAMLNAAFGKTRFDEFAAGNYYFTADADTSTPDGRKEFFTRLAVCLDRLASVPERLPPPAMAALENISSLTPQEADILMKMFPVVTPWTWRHGLGHERIIPLLQESLLDQERYGDLLAVAPHFWKMAKDINRPQPFRELSDFASKLQGAGLYDLAATYSSSGLDIAGTVIQDNIRVALQGVRRTSLHEIDAASITVDRSDPRYPIFQAQASFLSGNRQNAWELYDRHAARVLTMFTELDPYFCIWLIQRNTESAEFERANELSRQMMQWVDSLAEGFDREIKGQLLIAYADIALARQEYPRARALFERIVAAREFADTTAQKMADLRVAEVDRLSRNFDRAMERLERLARRHDRFLQIEGFYQMALIRFELEDYTESSKLLERVFTLEPNHTRARLLKGRLDLQMKRFLEATEVRVGLSTDRRILVPGSPLRIELDDKTGSVSARAESIEVTATTDSGDKETFNLFPLGDSRTKFRGEIPTRLGAPTPGNHRIELLGEDNVYYDYSEAFKKAHNLPDMPVRLEVASDSVLRVSSGRILTEDEEQQQLLQQLESDLDDMGFGFLDDDRSENIVRPGNPIYVRVRDYDRSVSTSPDTITVRASASSGSSIEAVELTETGPHTGVFAGAIPTTSAGATPYASDYSEGNPPIHAILEGDYAGWIGLLDNVRPKMFAVDLNDYVSFGTMTVLSETPGRRLRNFLLQTSVNGRDFETIGSWPAPFKAWDGSPHFEFVAWAERSNPTSLEDIKRYLETESVGRDISRARVPLRDMYASAESSDIVLDARRMKLNWPRGENRYAGRFRAAFYQPGAQTRTFRLDTEGGGRNTRYYFTINGSSASDGERRRGEELTIRRRLTRGVHFIDIYVFGTSTPAARLDLLCDSDEPPYMVSCPPAMFDPQTIPEIAEAIKDNAATITANEGETSFNVEFAPETFGRVVRLVMADFETDAPAINRLTLNTATGEQILPASPEELLTGRNNMLEIIPGDTISISYTDPRVVTEGREVQERIMTANFHNAEIWASVYRYQPGERVDIFIRDMDCSVSNEPDVISFQVRTQTGEPVEVKAMEQEQRRGIGTWEPSGHSGIFRGTFFPVSGEPKRPNEIQVGPEESLIVVYQDEENTDPGISWPRQLIIPQVSTEPPQLRVYEVTSAMIDDERMDRLAGELERRAQAGRLSREEFIPPIRELFASRPMRPDYEKPVSIISDGPLLVELTYPAIARSSTDEAWIYAQSLAAREKVGKTADDEFDTSVPGTIRVGANPGDFSRVEPPPGYLSVIVRGDPYASSAMFAGRFSFVVPKAFGPVPNESFASSTNTVEFQNRYPDLVEPLYLRGDDVIFVGFPFEDASGTERWITQSVEMESDVFFDVMDRHYREMVDSIHVGETLFFRVNHRAMDVTSDADTLTVQIETSGGISTNAVLTETFQHTGSFKGIIRPIYFEDPLLASEDNAIPVDYGETVKVTYNAPGHDPLTREVVIKKGADGLVVPFTKRFQDPEIAVQTQFLIAESYFELAKKHRELGQESLARRQIAHGRRLLMEAIRDFPDSDARAQADYLLADLALEYANDAENENIRRQNYMNAINGFSEVIARYPDSIYAPRAQYKKALAFEKMGDIDTACEEYVKLSYLYPESEFIPQTIARLGHYFAEKGREIEATLKETEDERVIRRLESEKENMFRTAAQVFGRLAPRFPTHELAGRTLVLSGQCYMRAGDFKRSIEVLGNAVRKLEDVDNELTAEAMYWRGDAFAQDRNLLGAYREFRKLTWDYPASKWAKYARGRLTTVEMKQVAEREADIR